MSAPLGVSFMLAVTVLTGCSLDESDQSTTATRRGEIVVAGLGATDSMSASVAGVVSRVGACIGLGDSLVIWPHGARWDAETSTLTFDVEGGYSAQLGQYVQGGGGTLALEWIQQGPAGSGDALVECGARPGDQVQVFGPDISVQPTLPPPTPTTLPAPAS